MKCVANHCGKEIVEGQPLLPIYGLKPGKANEHSAAPTEDKIEITGYIHAFHIDSYLLTWGTDTKYPLVGNLPLKRAVDEEEQVGYVKGVMSDYKPHLLVNCWCGGA